MQYTLDDLTAKKSAFQEGDMSHTLPCDFLVESERGPVYWWPLIFEAMLERVADFFRQNDHFVRTLPYSLLI
jgi:hypothetical protein